MALGPFAKGLKQVKRLIDSDDPGKYVAAESIIRSLSRLKPGDALSEEDTQKFNEMLGHVKVLLDVIRVAGSSGNIGEEYYKHYLNAYHIAQKWQF